MKKLNEVVNIKELKIALKVIMFTILGVTTFYIVFVNLTNYYITYRAEKILKAYNKGEKIICFVKNFETKTNKYYIIDKNNSTFYSNDNFYIKNYYFLYKDFAIRTHNCKKKLN